jgi:Flp pilus assembly protein TadG
MSFSVSSLSRLARRFRSEERGAAAVIVALSIVVIVAFMGFAIDIGHALQVRRALQGAVDAAALAGAQEINNGGDPVSVASAYSALKSSKNAFASNLKITMAPGFPQLKCFVSTGAPCTGAKGANGIVVRQQAVVPMYFAQIVGLPSITVTATATAGAAGGKPIPLNVMLVLDSTQSMNTKDSSCSIAGATRIDCALAGVRVLLGELTPSIDQVGLMTFPPILRNQSYDYDCNGATKPTIESYRSAGQSNYQVVGASNDYRASDDAKSLNGASNLVRAAAGGGCGSGMSAVGGVGTYYADAISFAQSTLASTAKQGMQNVIILLSDGDANGSNGNMPSGKVSNQCRQAIAAAQAATASGTWVYSIAYGASTSASGSCSTDNPHISACAAMQGIASDPAKFYSDSMGAPGGCPSQNPYDELVSIFKNVGQTLQAPRLLPDSTT